MTVGSRGPLSCHIDFAIEAIHLSCEIGLAQAHARAVIVYNGAPGEIRDSKTQPRFRHPSQLDDRLRPRDAPDSSASSRSPGDRVGGRPQRRGPMVVPNLRIAVGDLLDGRTFVMDVGDVKKYAAR